jgi:predicted MFS family arabinose efflux permease
MTQASPRLRIQLIAVTWVRMVINTAHRMIYPFQPAIARGLGLPEDAVALLLSARNALGVTAPTFGPISDRFGRRRAMLIGLAVFCCGLSLVGVFPAYVTLFVAVVLVVVSKLIFDPTLQAYLSDRTAYAQRGLVIALTELGWSGAALVGIPLAGLLIAYTQAWHAPLLPLAGLALAGGLLIWRVIPRDAATQADPAGPPVNQWAAVWGQPSVLAAMSIGLIVSLANESLLAVYGTWMEQAFGLEVAALGGSMLVIGIAELAGEGLVMWLADRLGKRRSILIGLGASAAAYALLPFAAQRLELALIGLFFVFIAFEFTIVASIPFMTEQVPGARATVMSGNMAFHAIGRMLGVPLGRSLFPLGFLWNGLVSAALSLLTLGIVVLFVRERK